MKVMTIVGTRPEIIKLACVIEELDKYTDHILVHTGQNYDYELNEIFFDGMNIRKPDIYMNAAGETPAETIGNTIAISDKLIKEHKPDAILLYGDTNSCLAVISAKRNKVPVFHMEAGNRCFDQRVPEETNRKIVDHTADINLTYSDIAREYLLREGLPADRIIKTGSPMYEVITNKLPDINASNIVEELKLTKNNYFVISAHREENISSDKNFFDLVDTLNTIADIYKLPIIISTHPRTRNKIDEHNIKFNPLISLMKPLGFNDYVKLQKDSRAVLSDSGTISEESSILGFPALNIREAHERPEAMEEASVMMVGLEKERILQGLEILDTQKVDTLRKVADYSMPNVSDKVLRIILSYTDYVNKTVWKKY